MESIGATVEEERGSRTLEYNRMDSNAVHTSIRRIRLQPWVQAGGVPLQSP
jgi:hypothetical protein